LLAFVLLHSRRTRRLLAQAAAAGLVLTLLVGPWRLLTLAGEAGVFGGFAGHLITRPALWVASVQTLEAYPLTGMGLRDFGGDYTLPPPPRFEAWEELYHGHPHNVALGVGVDLGLPGLAAYLALWFGALVMLWHVRQRSADPWLRGLAGGLIGAWVAYSVFGLADSITFNARVGIALWLMLGLAAATHRAARLTSPFPSAPPPLSTTGS
jgi:putative inorganic carbon (HCO3(-)) transporter